VARCVEPKQFHDVVGYYNRFDIFRLDVDRSPREPAAFTDDARAADRAAPAASAEQRGNGRAAGEPRPAAHDGF
jgi:aliphatic nitrilase